MSKQKTATSGAKVRKTLVNVLVHIFLAVLAFIWVLPVFWVVLTSFRAEKGSYVETFFPKSYTFDNYIKIFTDTSILNFPKMFMNTLIIAIFTCIISTIFVLSVSYCMSRMRFKMRKPFMNIAMDSLIPFQSPWMRQQSSMEQADGRYLLRLPFRLVNQLLYIPS